MVNNYYVGKILSKMIFSEFRKLVFFQFCPARGFLGFSLLGLTVVLTTVKTT